VHDFLEAITAGDEPIVAEPGGDGGTALVVFGGVASNPGMPPFEFFRVTEGLPVRRVFVRDPHSAFYALGIDGHGGGLDAVTRAVQPTVAGADRVVCVGNSAGGTAALVVGAGLGATEVHAFVPVTFLDRRRRLRHGDLRFRRSARAARRGDPVDAVAALAGGLGPGGRATVYFGDDSRLDVLHARRLEHVPGVTLRPVPGRDHSVIRTLRDDGTLRRILASAAAGTPAPGGGPVRRGSGHRRDRGPATGA
jgi:hypothetical protein